MWLEKLSLHTETHAALHLQRSVPAVLVSSWSVWSSAGSSCPSPAAALWPTHSVGRSWDARHTNTHTQVRNHGQRLRNSFKKHQLRSKNADPFKHKYSYKGRLITILDANIHIFLFHHYTVKVWKQSQWQIICHAKSNYFYGRRRWQNLWFIKSNFQNAQTHYLLLK